MLQRERSSATLVALSLAVGALSGQQAPPTGAAARVDAVFAAYDKATSPGCAVAVYQDDRVIYSHAYGMANLDHDVALTPGSVFHVASVSKQFTAAAILLLAQDGKLSIDDDIRKHVPELPDFGQPITIRQLANHTSGLRDQWDLLGLAGWRYSRDLITDDDVLDLLERQKGLNFTPGQRHLYSNSGYTLLAIIVSRVSGQSFRAFTDARIFKPLGMVNTHFRDNFAEIVKGQAYGYAPEGSGFRLSVTNFDTAGATSLLTTVEDMGKWHANFDRRAVGGERLVTGLLERGVLNDGRKIDYAFGVTHGTYRSLPTVGHGGSDAGYRSTFLRFPTQRLGVACLCNLSTTNPQQLALRVADVYLPVTLPRAAGGPADVPELAIPAEQLARYAGFYWNAPEVASREFVVEDGRLYQGTGPGKVALKSLGGGAFLLPSGGARLVFEDGLAAGPGTVRLRTGSEPWDVFVRSEPFKPTREQLAEFAGVYRSDEMDIVLRFIQHDAELKLERIKHRPATLLPVVADTFRAAPYTIRFDRSGNGQVTGVTLDTGRIRQVKFQRDR